MEGCRGVHGGAWEKANLAGSGCAADVKAVGQKRTGLAHELRVLALNVDDWTFCRGAEHGAHDAGGPCAGRPAVYRGVVGKVLTTAVKLDYVAAAKAVSGAVFGRLATDNGLYTTVLNRVVAVTGLNGRLFALPRFKLAGTNAPFVPAAIFTRAALTGAVAAPNGAERLGGSGGCGSCGGGGCRGGRCCGGRGRGAAGCPVSTRAGSGRTAGATLRRLTALAALAGVAVGVEDILQVNTATGGKEAE